MNLNNHEEEVDAKLIHETLEFLSNVTYLRVIVDRVTFDVAPNFLGEESRRIKSPRNRGRIHLIYQIPALSKLTPRGSGKIVKVVAKDVSERTILFVDKHVTLLRITPAIIDNWASNHCEMKFFYTPANKRMNICFAKCSVPMSKILVLPFSFNSSNIKLEMAADFLHCGGFLKLCIQLGSRLQHFTEKVEPMRNSTTSHSPTSFIKPLESKSSILKEGREESDFDSQRYFVEKPTKLYDGADFACERIIGRESPVKLADQRKIWQNRNPIVRSPAPSRMLSDDGQFDFLSHRRRWTGIGENYAFETGSPYLTPKGIPPKPLNLIDRKNPSPEIDEFSVWKLNNKKEYSPIRSKKEKENNFHVNIEPWIDRQSRRHTVAERLKNKISMDFCDPSSIGSSGRSDFPQVSANGYWLQVTICQAKHLPLVKCRKNGPPTKPNCYVTYRNNEGVFASDVVPNSLSPVWNWTTQLFLPKDRKNIVFKIWHRADHGKDHSKVLGFIATEPPQKLSIEPIKNWYDIMDLARVSSGQLQVSFGSPSPLSSHPRPTDDNAVSEKLWGDDSNSSSKSVSPNQNGRQSPDKPEALLIDFGDPRANLRLRFDEKTAGNDQKTIESMDKGSNTSFSIDKMENSCQNRRDSFDAFVDLTSRSFLADKLKHNIDELSGLLNRMNRRSTSAHADWSKNQ